MHRPPYIYKHNINIHIMVINSIICRGNLAYNVTLYTKKAKEKGIQCAEEANITNINRYFSLTTPYTEYSVFLSNIILVIKKVNFCSKLKLMKSELLRIILFI